MKTELDKERYSREFLEYQQTDNYKKFIAEQEAVKNSNEELSTSKKSKKTKKKDYKHVSNVHDGRKGIFKCDLCDKYFASKRSLKVHIDNGHGEKCEICGKYLKHADSLKVHKRQVHGGPINCEKCNKQLQNRGNMVRHLKFACTKNPDSKAYK